MQHILMEFFIYKKGGEGLIYRSVVTTVLGRIWSFMTVQPPLILGRAMLQALRKL